MSFRFGGTADIVAFTLPEVTLGRLRHKMRSRRLLRGFCSQKVGVGAGTSLRYASTF
jgi:hypothetical protein